MTGMRRWIGGRALDKRARILLGSAREQEARQKRLAAKRWGVWRIDADGHGAWLTYGYDKVVFEGSRADAETEAKTLNDVALSGCRYEARSRRGDRPPFHRCRPEEPHVGAWTRKDEPASVTMSFRQDRRRAGLDEV